LGDLRPVKLVALQGGVERPGHPVATRWRLIAPDFPGFGYSDTPDQTSFPYTFDGYADFLDRFATVLSLTRYALYLHDYGSQIGLRLAMKAPERIAALIIQNGDIYEDELGPKYMTDSRRTGRSRRQRAGRSAARR